MKSVQSLFFGHSIKTWNSTFDIQIIKSTLNVTDTYSFTFQGYSKLSPVAVYSCKQLIKICKLFSALISLLHIKRKQSMTICLLKTCSFMTDSIFSLI